MKGTLNRTRLMFYTLTSSQTKCGDCIILRLFSRFVPRNDLKFAFTFAEVLITLLIIGVVASLVMPALIQDSQNEELTVMFKKNYSAYSDAARRMMMDNGGNLAGLFANSFEMQNKFGEYINLTKKCAYGVQGCFYPGVTTWNNLHGDDGWIDHVSYGGAVFCSTAVMNNGSIVMFRFRQNNCEAVEGSNGSPTEHMRMDKY